MVHRLHATVATFLCAASLAACRGAPPGEVASPAGEAATAPAPPAIPPSQTAAPPNQAPRPAAAGATANVVEVTALDYAFGAPAEIPAGLTTFRMRNAGREHHFMFLQRLPEGKDLAAYGAEVGAPFMRAMAALEAGGEKAEVGAQLGSELPEWYLTSAKPAGAVGLVAPGGDAQVTVQLEPGRYVMECYVKTPAGKFHSEFGMVRELIVTGAEAGAAASGAAPAGHAGHTGHAHTGAAAAADIRITVSNAGIAVEGEPTAGTRRVAVHFAEHPQYGLGNDVHVVRLRDNTDLDRLAAWMDWMNLDGLRAPAPAEFIGGTHELPVGETSYFTIQLEPGRYAWIPETPEARRMLREFTVR